MAVSWGQKPLLHVTFYIALQLVREILLESGKNQKILLSDVYGNHDLI